MTYSKHPLKKTSALIPSVNETAAALKARARKRRTETDIHLTGERKRDGCEG